MDAPIPQPGPPASPPLRDRWSRRAALAVTLLAVAVAALFRLWRLGVDPLWLDEAYSAFAAAHGWGFLWQVVPTYETHPPVYYSLLHIWRGLAGDSVTALRAIGAGFALATLAVAWIAAATLGHLTGRRPDGRLWLGATAVALVALDPLLIEMGHQVRPYPVMVFVYAAALIPLLRIAAARADGLPPPRAALAWFCAGEAAMLWLHSLGPLFAGAMALALLAVLRPRSLARVDWARIAGAHILVALVWLPGVLILLDQAPTWVASTWLVWRPALLWINLGAIYGTWDFTARLITAALIAIGVGTLVADRRRRGTGVALAILALLPTAASLAITLTVSPVFIARTLSPVTVPGLLLIASAIPASRRDWRWLAVPPVLALLLSMAVIDGQVMDAPAPQDWYGTIRWLAPRVHPTDEVWAYPNEGALPFRYAARDLRWRIAVRPLPTEVPATHVRGFYPTGSRGVISLYPDDIARLAASPAARAPDTIWLLRLGPWAYDKGDLMLKALAANRVMIGHWRSGPIDLIGLRRRSAPIPPPEQAQP